MFHHHAINSFVYSPTHSVASTSFDEHSTSVDAKPSTTPAQNAPIIATTSIDNVDEEMPIADDISDGAAPQSSPPHTSQTAASVQSPASPTPSTPPPQQIVQPTTAPIAAATLEELNHTAALLNEAKEKLKLEKKERHAAKKLIKELAACKTMLEAMEVMWLRRFFIVLRNLKLNFLFFLYSSYTRTHGHFYYL